jgi:hypothetical protein
MIFGLLLLRRIWFIRESIKFLFGHLPESVNTADDAEALIAAAAMSWTTDARRRRPD